MYPAYWIAVSSHANQTDYERRERTYSDDNTKHESRDLGSIVEGAERVSDEPEKGRSGECRKVGKQEKGEVETRIDFETGHEVDNDGEDENLDQEDG